MTTITAQTILRSWHSQRPDKILSTLLLRYPRWIHAEFMTHRQFSRNAASSRAIPVAKLIQDVIDNPAVPIFWGKNQKGMQAGEELSGVDLIQAMSSWSSAKNSAIKHARNLAGFGAHKQIVNRVLEPFAHITVLVSATEWTNFLALRDHTDAEPHIQMLAREIRRELDRTDNVQTLQPGEWHTPFATDAGSIHDILINEDETRDALLDRLNLSGRDALIRKSVACCASTSYKTVDGFEMTLEKAIEIHDKLVGSTPLHASPAEHVAQADDLHRNQDGSIWNNNPNAWAHRGQHANFVGFRQYRRMLPGESS